MKRIMLLVLLVSKVCLITAQDIRVEDLLNKATEYYQIDKHNYFTIKSRYKSSIANDTSSAVATFFITGKGENFYLLVTNDDRYNYLCSPRYYIYFDTDLMKYDSYNPKEVKNLGYYSVYTTMPFADPGNFFNEFKNADIIGKETNSWILKKGNNYLQISKRNYSIERMYTVNNTKLGVEYSEYVIVQANYKQPEKTLQEYADYILSNFLPMEESISKKKLTSGDVGTEFVDFSLLSVNKNVYTKEKLKGKYVVFDLFYQSCLPCIKSFSDWIDLRKNYDTTQLVILGIDPVPYDTLSMKKFMERYNINYDVIVGKDADSLWKSIGNSGFPYTVVLDPAGNIFYVIEYYQPKLFKKFKKLLAENIK